MKKRIILIVVLVIIGIPLLGYLVATVAGLLARDIASVDTTKVYLSPVVAPDAPNNGSSDLSLAVEKLFYPDGDANPTNPTVKQALDGKGWDDAILQEILGKNEEALALFTSASTKRFQDPDLADPVRVNLNTLLAKNLSAYRHLAEVQGVAAIDQLSDKQPDAAATTALTIIRLGGKMESSYGSMIHYLVAQRMKELGVDVLERIVNTAQLSPDVKQQALDTLAASYDRGARAAQALKFENALLRNTKPSHEDKIMMGEATFGPVLARVFAENDFYFQPKRTEQLVVDWYARLITTIGSSCTAHIPVWRTLAPQSVVVRLWTPNAIGKSSLDAGAISFDGLQKRWCSLDAKIEALTSKLKM